MVTWLKVVCAIDFSESSRAALEQAADLARRFEAELTLVHVWKGARAAGERIAFSPPALTLEEEAELGHKLGGWRREAERLSGREVRTAVMGGSPIAEIPRYATEQKADLVVVGTHGRTGIERAVLGSVAEAIVRHSPCTVLVARPQELGD